MDKPPEWPPTRRDCIICGAGYLPKAVRQKYCSSQCRERSKYVRLRSDPTRWAGELERMRDKYTPTGTPRGKPPTHLVCTREDCDSKHLARGFCRRHYYQDRYRRGLGRRAEPEFTMAMVKHYDATGRFIEEAAPQRLVCRVSSSHLIPECPDCGEIMRLNPNNQGLDLRICEPCGAVASLNVEEVSWLIYEKHSTGQRKPTTN